MRASFRSVSDRWERRCLRGVLAAWIALAVVLTLFNCGCCTGIDSDETVAMVSITPDGCGAAGKPGPLSTAPHCCHCLAHATILAPQVDAVAIDFGAHPYRLAAASASEAAALSSPFKPPRA